MIPTEVDCIIVGTGLTNSILAAACSRIGRSVLHIDKNNYYGDSWASFTFQQFVDWVNLNSPQDEELEEVPQELINKSRMFCIDLCPRLLYSNGPMVELLVKSNVSRYHEFKNNIRILSLVNNEIHVMPCRRSDVFTSPLLSDLVDKRKLMKFIEMCIKYNPNSEDTEVQCQIRENSNKPISLFLEENGLKPALKEYIINSIAMVEPTETTQSACEKIKLFMIATERYGRSPFIFPLYGCGEFPQSFCRLSAVFGGIYCLNTQIDDLKVKPSPENQSQNFQVKLSNSENQVSSEMLILDLSSAIKLQMVRDLPKHDEKISRAILFTRKSIVCNDDNLISFLRIPPSEHNLGIVHLLEFNSSVSVCPPDINMVYLWTNSTSSSSKSDLSNIVKRFFSETELLWVAYFQQPTRQQVDLPNESAEIKGFYITNPPSNDIDYEHSIKEAESIFLNMYPDQEFLPRAPDPDEIISE